MLPDRVIRVNPPRTEPDRWRFVADVDGEVPAGAIVVTLATWLSRRETLLARAQPIGVALEPADDPDSLRGDLAALNLIAVNFPKAADGRGYSTAVLLRRAGFRGELRAYGDIGRDHLLFLERCGFDAFSLAAGKDADAALVAFAELAMRYQGTVVDARPLFRRRAHPGGTHG